MAELEKMVYLEFGQRDRWWKLWVRGCLVGCWLRVGCLVGGFVGCQLQLGFSVSWFVVCG